MVYVGTDTRFRVRLSEHVTLSVREQNIISTPDPAGYYADTDTRFRVRLGEHVTLSVREQNIISTPDPAGYYADTNSPAYAVWLRDAARILIG
jgi:hypothetical protein